MQRVSPENNMKRSENISRLVENYKRSYGDHHNNPLLGCEVCWTCKYFITEGNGCILSYEDVKRRGGSRFDTFSTDYYKDYVHVKNPGWFRCRWWEEDG